MLNGERLSLHESTKERFQGISCAYLNSSDKIITVCEGFADKESSIPVDENAVLADKDIMQHYPYVFDENWVRSWIERNMQRYKENGFGLWAVCLKETGEMIGDCGLTLQNIDGEMLPEIGYHIRKDCQRKGYAKEAASDVRDWAFEHTDYPSLYSYCKYTNEASYKTAEAIGMHFEKEYPDEANKITHVSVIHRDDLI